MSFSELVKLLEQNEKIAVRYKDQKVLEVSGNNRFVKITREEGNPDAWYIRKEWLGSPQILASRIVYRLGLGERIHARKCQVARLDKATMEHFLENYHIHGVAGAKHKFGLYYKDDLIALVSFASPRNMDGRRSAELVRYCVKPYCAVRGGLDKLLNHYVREYPCDDIFTYVDLAWSNGEGFKRIGFKEEGWKKIKGWEVAKLRLSSHSV